MALLDPTELTPHGFCLSWDPALLGLHITSDAVIALAYFTIPVALTVLVNRRRDLAFPWVFSLFALFITACGTTHLMDIWTLWHPDYVLQGVIKAVTAIASIATAAALWPMLPAVLALPSPAMLREANDKLAAQLSERDKLLFRLRRETADRERAEGLLRQAQRSEAIGQLTGGVAHDFHNLLLVAKANLDLLQRRLPDDPAAQMLIGRALEATDRGESLTQLLLSFSQQQQQKATEFDVDALVRRLDTMLRSTLAENVTMELRLAGKLPAVDADSHQLESALLNLVINARDAMPDGGVLRIETREARVDHTPADDLPIDLPPGRYVCIAVADTGVGMTPEVQRAAFDAFFTTKSAGRSGGLGLSQVQGFVTQSNGHLSLSSQVGKGTVVRMFLPAAGPRRNVDPVEVDSVDEEWVSAPFNADTGGWTVATEEGDLIPQREQFITDRDH
jgi:signal transduction histidine kinase